MELHTPINPVITHNPELLGSEVRFMHAVGPVSFFFFLMGLICYGEETTRMAGRVFCSPFL